MSSLAQKMKLRAQKASLEEDRVSFESFNNMPLSEMGQQTIDFGEKYRGQSMLDCPNGF